MSRVAIGKARRFEILKRDGFACQYCGAVPPAAILEVDHIVAVAEGGGNDADNLITACFNCNRGKAARSLEDVPQALSDRAAITSEREAQIAGYQAVMDARRQRVDEDAWEVIDILYGVDDIAKDRFVSIRRFIEKLDKESVVEAAEIAVSRKAYGDPWRYFCGICWNKVRELGE